MKRNFLFIVVDNKNIRNKNIHNKLLILLGRNNINYLYMVDTTFVILTNVRE